MTQASEAPRSDRLRGAFRSGDVAPAGTLRHPVLLATAVAIAHGINDAYVAFLHPLLPRIMDNLGLSVTLAATLAMVLSLAASLVQPLMGHLADRYGRRLFVVLGPVLCAVFLSLIGVAPSFALLVLFLTLGGLGSAMFHPPGASMAVRVSEGKGTGLRYSLFSFGGSAGYALGPLIAVGLVAVLGLRGLAFAMVPMLLLAPLLWWLLPAGRSERPATPPPSLRALLALLRGPLGLLFAISAIGAFVQRVFLTMEPIVVAQAGGSEAAGATALSIYLGGSALGSLVAGPLADRIDRRGLLAALAAVGTPSHMLALWLAPASAGSLAAAFVAGFCIMAMLPPVVVMAQELVPEGAAVSSGIVMGLAWAAGSVGVLGTGMLGDVYSARAAALLSVPVLLAAAVLSIGPGLRPVARAR